MRKFVDKHRIRLTSAAIAGLLLLSIASQAVVVQMVAADSVGELRREATKVQKQIDKNDKKTRKLHKRGDTLENRIKKLDLKIKKLNKEIRVIDLRIKALDEEIAVVQAELDRQKALLRTSMIALYKRGDVSEVELLIGADTFAEFINETEYLERLKQGIQDSANTIIDLKQELQAKQLEQEELREQREDQKTLLQETKQEQKELLRETRGEEKKYRQRLKKLRQQQAELLAELVARSQVLVNIGTGQYPWAKFKGSKWTHAASCSYTNPRDIDPWGYCYRQCTSYAAWKLHDTGRKPGRNYGNATYWGIEAKAEGIPTGPIPKKGAIAVWSGYGEGHVAFVEEVRPNGQVRISEYNAVPALKGKYSQRLIHPSDPTTYIYFPKK